jgi:hypothetical protein
MKHSLRTNKSIQNIGTILIILVFALTLIGAAPRPNLQVKSVSQAEISNAVKTQQDPNSSDEEKIKAVIDAYFVTRYESQRLIAAQDFSSLIEDQNLDWVKKEKEKREIELYIATLFNLGYQSYSYTLDYDSIEIGNNKATVYLRESHEVIFNATAPDPSKLADLPHVFTLHNKKGLWVIHKDEYEDELAKQFKHMNKDEIKKQVDENFKNEQKAYLPSSKVKAMPLDAPLGLTNYSYNRTAAVNYANQYWSTYNTAWYATNPGTDCANFVSQAIYKGEGKNPPDTSGMTTASNRSYAYDWYYVWNNSGSLPWVRVADQYSFIIGNTGRIGPYGWGGANYLCYAKAGDVVQLKGVNTPNVWDHEGILVYAAGPCTSLSNYKVNAHTANRYQYPLSNWASFPIRYILISGWKGN